MFLIFGKIDKIAFARLLDKKFDIISEIRKEKGDLLKMTDFALRKNKKSLKDIKGIFVVNDSGTFSGVRGAVTIGNILSFALKIPATAVSVKDIDNITKLKEALKKQTFIVAPDYGREPNITFFKPKTKNQRPKTKT